MDYRGPEILVRRFREGMKLPLGVQPNSSFPARSQTYECEVALHRMSNGELWLMRRRGEEWLTLRPATNEDAGSFISAGLAFLSDRPLMA